MSELLLCWRHALQRSNVLHSLGNTSHHFQAVERPLSGRGSADRSEATEHWRCPGLFRVMRFISRLFKMESVGSEVREYQRLRRQNGLIVRTSILNERAGQSYKVVHCKVTRQRRMIWHIDDLALKIEYVQINFGILWCSRRSML